MQGAFVELTCPNCDKLWEEDANDLPDVDADFECPDCGTVRPLSEFARTERDVEVIREL